MNVKRVLAIANKEFIQIKRDPRSLALAIVIPVFLLLIFGYGLSLDIDHVRMAVWNQDASSKLTRDFLNNFRFSKYFKIVSYTDNYLAIVDLALYIRVVIGVADDFKIFGESEIIQEIPGKLG